MSEILGVGAQIAALGWALIPEGPGNGVGHRTRSQGPTLQNVRGMILDVGKVLDPGGEPTRHPHWVGRSTPAAGRLRSSVMYASAQSSRLSVTAAAVSPDRT